MCNDIWEIHAGNMDVSVWSIPRVVACFVRHLPLAFMPILFLPFLVVFNVGNLFYIQGTSSECR